MGLVGSVYYVKRFTKSLYAIVGRADYLVTGDRDLLVFKRIAGLEIVTPAALLALLA